MDGRFYWTLAVLEELCVLDLQADSQQESTTVAAADGSVEVLDSKSSIQRSRCHFLVSVF